MFRKQMLKESKKMIAAALIGVTIFTADPSMVQAATWKSDSKGWWYCEDNGFYPANQWKKIDGQWYWFDGKGYMVTGWQKINGKWYYFETSGKMLQSTWKKINNKYYYFKSSGCMATDAWIENSYVDASGVWIPNQVKPKAQWMKSGKRWWYCYADGNYAKNKWEKIGGKWYRFDKAGWMVTGWNKVGSKWYYMDPKTGAMYGKGWHWIQEKCYYMNGNGEMAADAWIDGYYVDGSGVYQKNAKGTIYVTRYGKVNVCDKTAFQFEIPNGWKVDHEELGSVSDIIQEQVILKNSRGVKITYWDCTRKLQGGSQSMLKAQITKADASSFVPGYPSGTNKDCSDLGEFMVGRIHVTGEMLIKLDKDFSPIDSTSFAVIPTSYLGERTFMGQAGLVGEFSFDYPKPIAFIAEAPEGKFTAQEEKDVIRILRSFKEAQ